MSIAHLGLSDQSPSGENRGEYRAERTPPHDMLAEQSALGGMLLSKDAVADVVESVRGVDFYIPKHEIIFDAILSLYSHGEPTDVIAVTDELIKTGELSRAGGADYLHTLTSLVPTAANAGFYASHRRRARPAAPPRRSRHPHRADGLRRRGRGRSTSSTPPRPRSTASPVRRRPRTTFRSTKPSARPSKRSKRTTGHDGGMSGTPDRLRRDGRPDQRLPRRPAHHRRRPPSAR